MQTELKRLPTLEVGEAAIRVTVAPHDRGSARARAPEPVERARHARSVNIGTWALILVALAGPLAPATGNARAAADVRAAEAVRRTAQEAYTAFFHGNYERFVDALYPPLVRTMGGRERVVAQIRGDMEKMRSSGVTIKAANVTAPLKIVRVGHTEVQTLMLSTLLAATPNGDIEIPSYILGISADRGKTWKFIDAGKMGRPELVKVVPTLSGEIEIPARPAAVPVRKQPGTH